MEEDFETKAALERKKRRLERLLMGVTVLVIIGLTVLQTYIVRAGAGAPKVNSILVFALINVNIILLFFLLFLVLRNLYNIFFQSRREVIGGKLRTKLVVAFVSLSLVPTAMLFFVAIQFITSSHDSWFESNVEQSLIDSLELSRLLSDLSRRFTMEFGGNIKAEIERGRIYRTNSSSKLKKYLQKKRETYHFSLIEIYSPGLELKASVTDPELEFWSLPPMPMDILREAAASGQPQTWVETTGLEDAVRVIRPIFQSKKSVAAILVVGYRFPEPFKEKTVAVARGLEGYRQLQRLRDPIKVSHFISLTIVALLIIFVSTWIGFHLAKGITGPLVDLAEGTEKIAGGDYDFTIKAQSSDEIGTLVASFNRMTRDLKTSKIELTRKNIELLDSYTELDQRRRYMEIILQNVAAGVISADSNGTIITINDSAEEIMRLNTDEILGRRYQDIMAPEHRAILDELVQAAQRSPRGSAEKQVRIKIRDQVVSLHLHLTQLKDESGDDVGIVIVFDDLSDMEKAQRMAAWREVARRIAHEIKNPLTPIQLSTQRLRKRYGERFGDDGQVFDECTRMIIRQVKELKRLVDEFSNFARMPEADPAPNDLAEIVEETLVLYHEGHKDVEFVLNKNPDLPIFNLDREQMKRVLINLLDNAVAAVDGKGRIEINLAFDKLLKIARLEIADNGPGISPADKTRLFEPYFSTKKSGTGLGLAIASSIVADHNGFVRVQDNHPRGTRFIIELPVQN
ncbi:MAG: ATP-binding protein [Thermodesulfobacteriota bacterium]|nr:ATP-binding protein [Thermodesulfobacteriota bacterium]